MEVRLMKSTGEASPVRAGRQTEGLANLLAGFSEGAKRKEPKHAVRALAERHGNPSVSIDQYFLSSKIQIESSRIDIRWDRLLWEVFVKKNGGQGTMQRGCSRGLLDHGPYRCGDRGAT